MSKLKNENRGERFDWEKGKGDGGGFGYTCHRKKPNQLVERALEREAAEGVIVSSKTQRWRDC